MEALRALLYDLVDRALERETIVTVLVIYLIVSGQVTNQTELIGLLVSSSSLVLSRGVAKMGSRGDGLS